MCWTGNAAVISFFHLLLTRSDGASGEWRCVDRAPESRPEILDRAQMVLMGMGQYQADQILCPLFNEGGVRHDHVDAGRALVAEGDAAIYH